MRISGYKLTVLVMFTGVVCGAGLAGCVQETVLGLLMTFALDAIVGPLVGDPAGDFLGGLGS